MACLPLYCSPHIGLRLAGGALALPSVSPLGVKDLAGHADKNYVLGLEQALVQIRTMFNNQAIRAIVDEALRGEFDEKFYSSFRKCFWEAVREDFYEEIEK